MSTLPIHEFFTGFLERINCPHDVVIRYIQLVLRIPGTKKRVCRDEINDALRRSRATSCKGAPPVSHLFVYPQSANKCVLGLARNSVKEVADPVTPISLFGDGAQTFIIVRSGSLKERSEERRVGKEDRS